MHLGQETREENVAGVVFRTAFYSGLSNLVIFHMSKWFTANKLILNINKINTIKFVANNSPHCALSIRSKETYTEERVKNFLVNKLITTYIGRIAFIK